MEHKKTLPASLSITKRLTVLYAVSAFILLAISAVFLDWILISDMEKEDNQFLASEVQSLRILLHEHPDDINAWKKDIERETIASASVFIKYYVRILDEEGRVLVETPGMKIFMAPSSFPIPLKSFNPEIKVVKQKGRDGRPFLLMAAFAEPTRSNMKERLIQMALDMSHEDAIIRDYRKKVALVLFFGVLFSALIGFAVAHEGLRPLKKIAQAFKGIGPEQLHNRVGSEEWPEEIAVLALAFDRMIERLEESFTALSQFSADLAHELRTPINNLRGEAEVSLYKARTTDEYRQVIESSLEEYERLSRMIENLLFLARAESRDTVVRHFLINTHKEIEVLLEFYEAVSEEKHIEINNNGSVMLEADPILFRQALSNILSNAFQYTPEGGRIIITSGKLEDGSALIEVSDTGIGIEPEHLPKIFNRFYRTEQARSHYPHGTGLGFSIVKSIMELHNGSVTIQSQPGKGTTVALVFHKI
jgi:two-component system, OmpR family, heavy metal sensor histidine kinase CusS